ncbi:hypothetical protein I5M32_11180 [Pedobacter sp. SD-b]|uniref:Uncharacterized protein n=1 Tax=Pedobacter segetis TaxID=2793069 RepID=A0ABS1BKV8_9SPHI|nr:hypothetical protein [Pedobacter segetis]MBK0383519.1 hypothetical protein [Pedobacter segetis]
MANRKFWTPQKIAILKKKYPLGNLKDLALELDCTITALKKQASNHKISKSIVKKTDWTDLEIEYLKNNFGKTSNKELSDYYKKNNQAIRTMAQKLGLKKQKWAWKIGEEKYVALNYGKLPIEEMITHLSKTKWAIINKYRELNGLRKSGDKTIISDFTTTLK